MLSVVIEFFIEVCLELILVLIWQPLSRFINYLAEFKIFRLTHHYLTRLFKWFGVGLLTGFILALNIAVGFLGFDYRMVLLITLATAGVTLLVGLIELMITCTIAGFN